jgi:RNA polymerase sigma-70 factor (ECF subfamily)
MCTVTTSQQLEPTWTQISLAAARRGDREAFATLVSPHASKLQRLAHRLTRSAEDAEDVCQESLLKAFTKLHQFDGSKTEIHEFCAWLTRITRNCAIDFLRRKRANPCVPFEDCHENATRFQARKTLWGESPETTYTRAEQLAIIREAIRTLPPELRMVCVFCNLGELSGKEVAARLGISTLAVRLRLFRAHRQVRKMVGRRIRHLPRPR